MNPLCSPGGEAGGNTSAPGWSAGVVVLAVTLFALALRLAFLDLGIESERDSYNILAVANAYLHGQPQLLGVWGSHIWPTIQPLYPLLVALLTAITGNLFMSGKLVALAAGVLVVPATFFLWREIEGAKVGLLAALLLAFNSLAVFYSVHAFRDTLFLFLFILSFTILYRYHRIGNSRLLPLLGLLLGLAAMTREEGYILAVASLVSLAFWGRFRLVDMARVVLPFALVVLPWNIYRTLQTGSIIPPYAVYEWAYENPVGLLFGIHFVEAVTLPFFLLAMCGAYLARQRWRAYLPLYLFGAGFYLSHALYPFGLHYSLPLLPLVLGLAAVAVVRLPVPSPRWRPWGSAAAVLGLLIVLGGSYAEASALSGPNRYEVIREAMGWFDSKTEPGAVLLAEDQNAYSMFAKKRVLGYRDMTRSMDEEATDRFDLYEPFFTFLIVQNVTHVVQWDTLSEYMYRGPVQDRFEEALNTWHPIVFRPIKFDPPPDKWEVRQTYTVQTGPLMAALVKFTPVTTFEKNGERVELVRFEYRILSLVTPNGG